VNFVTDVDDCRVGANGKDDAFHDADEVISCAEISGERYDGLAHTGLLN
jgi:hypothetical protein